MLPGECHGGRCRMCVAAAWPMMCLPRHEARTPCPRHHLPVFAVVAPITTDHFLSRVPRLVASSFLPFTDSCYELVKFSCSLAELGQPYHIQTDVALQTYAAASGRFVQAA